MNIELAEKIAGAVLYEGYILYPYRPSSVKNRQRWTFGGIYPPAHAAIQGGSDRCIVQTECLIEIGDATTLEVRLRFLHLQDRRVEAIDKNNETTFHPVAGLRVGDREYLPWQEAIEREIVLRSFPMGGAAPLRQRFSFPAQCEREIIRDETGSVVGAVTREQYPLEGALELEVASVQESVSKLKMRVLNCTAFEDAHSRSRDEALLQSFVSAHAVLGVRDGTFISLLDPGDEYRTLAEGCRNEGVYPVLVGEEGERDMMLASPIILYDYPQIAPESPGDLFDGTEIDEILTLRILTMTDEEKREARQSDERARALLDRTEALPWEELSKLHGTLRYIRPVVKAVEASGGEAI